MSSITQAPLESRAVLRPVEPGSDAACPYCGVQVRFAARQKGRKVIANVYVDGRWDRVETYHEGCYARAGEPHGPARA
ncbi:MAG: hypothetical protein ACYCXN_11580 [Acidimicrobiales bacterium]